MTEEKFIEILQNAVEKVRNEEDPVELNNYRKLFKKNVPFALRNYVAAYLTKNAEGTSRRDSYKRYNKEYRHEGSRFTKEPKNDFESQPSAHNVIDEALASTLFISIGRNRHVFPRDLIGLITQNTGLERNRIGEIRVLDNYSFVQFYTEDCDSVIKALDGYTYRGRKLNVSFSKKKTDNDDGYEMTSSQRDAEDSISDSDSAETSDTKVGNGEFLV
ncbi:MAG: DbpA RNA binding domain-containing protein [Treponemataceae bacterium]|nr:DbpA RNA binding domain-containing protein [Treponemataceae bacterium]